MQSHYIPYRATTYRTESIHIVQSHYIPCRVNTYRTEPLHTVQGHYIHYIPYRTTEPLHTVHSDRRAITCSTAMGSSSFAAHCRVIHGGSCVPVERSVYQPLLWSRLPCEEVSNGTPRPLWTDRILRWAHSGGSVAGPVTLSSADCVRPPLAGRSPSSEATIIT